MNPEPRPPDAGDLFGELPDTATLGEVRALIRDGWLRGTTCPACGSRVQLYRRRITASTAYVLVALAAEARRLDRGGVRPSYVTADGFVRVGSMLRARNAPTAITRNGEFGTARYWGLVERSPDRRDDGHKSNGLWRLTELGRGFAEGRESVPRDRFVYLDTVRDPAVAGVPLDAYCDHAGNRVTVTIGDCLNERFDFDTLMNALADGGDTRRRAAA